jgi:hypothetical protein
MMDMMERMMGKNPDGEGEGKDKSKGDQPGDNGGGGASGESDAANNGTGGQAGGKNEARRVPKASGASEFRKALDAYNRGAEEKLK